MLPHARGNKNSTNKEKEGLVVSQVVTSTSPRVNPHVSLVTRVADHSAIVLSTVQAYQALSKPLFKHCNMFKRSYNRETPKKGVVLLLPLNPRRAPKRRHAQTCFNPGCVLLRVLVGFPGLATTDRRLLQGYLKDPGTRKLVPGQS